MTVRPELHIALLHVPAHVREAFRALFEIHAAMEDVVARSTDPALGRIKLAWWREQLEALDEHPAPAEPRLQAVSKLLLPIGIRGADLARLEAGWTTLLDEEIEPELIAARGEKLFELGGKLLGRNDWRLADAGALYALASASQAEAEIYRRRLSGHRFPPELRPLTMLARTAGRGGGRRAALAMLAHRWSGRVC
jgi:phytoene synthase